MSYRNRNFLFEFWTLLSFNKDKKKKRERKTIEIDNNYNERLDFSLDLVLLIFCNFSMFKGDKNKIRGLRYFLQIGLHFEKFRMFFFVFLRIGQIKVSYYIEKSKIWKFSSGCSFFDITKVGRAWKMFGKYDAIFTIGSLACKFYRHQYQSLKLGFFFIFILHIFHLCWKVLHFISIYLPFTSVIYKQK